jgi:hypothetical protein
MPQFVILKHDDPRGIHYDFMLEAGGVLKTWALPQPPVDGLCIECQALGDHRAAYLDYEGPLSGGRGSVTRWDRGTYDIVEQNETLLVVRIAGEKAVGNATFCAIAGRANLWQFSFPEQRHDPRVSSPV